MSSATGFQLPPKIAPDNAGRTPADTPRRPRMKSWWARSDSTTRGKPLKHLGYQEFDPRRCP